MDISVCNTCGKSVKDRYSIKCNLCLAKVHLRCNYLNYVDSQYIKFSIKHAIAKTAVKTIPCLVTDSIVLGIRINHAEH